MTPAQIKQQEELRILQTKLHEDWLKHPVTVDFIKILTERGILQTNTLCQHILVESNEKYEDKCRASIASITAIKVIATNTPNFIQELNKLTPK